MRGRSKEKHKETNRRWYQKNKVKLSARYEKYYQEHREHILQKQREQLLKLKESPEKYQLHLKKKREAGKKYGRDYKNHTVKRWKKRRLLELFASRGNKCELCGFDNILALQLHHKNGRPKEESKERILTKSYPKELVQILCANCHTIIHRKENWLCESS